MRLKCFFGRSKIIRQIDQLYEIQSELLRVYSQGTKTRIPAVASLPRKNEERETTARNTSSFAGLLGVMLMLTLKNFNGSIFDKYKETNNIGYEAN